MLRVLLFCLSFMYFPPFVTGEDWERGGHASGPMGVTTHEAQEKTLPVADQSCFSRGRRDAAHEGGEDDEGKQEDDDLFTARFTTWLRCIA